MWRVGGLEGWAVLIVSPAIQLCLIIITALGAGVKRDAIAPLLPCTSAPLLSLSLHRYLQNFVGGVVGQGDDFEVPGVKELAGILFYATI
ncbi:MAG: hypothetical protein DPW09_13325, partial [Anaerolineae bacterium]|nr:hypothetical protein [Anaerolineae bacterium]